MKAINCLHFANCVGLSMMMFSCDGATLPKEETGAASAMFFQQPDSEKPQVEQKATADGIAVVSFVPSNMRCNASQRPPAQMVSRQSLFAWKGERVSTQVFISAQKKITGLAIKVTGAGGANGIPPDAVKCSFQRYISANYSAGMCGNISKGLPEVRVADAISPQQSVDIVPGGSQPVWISVTVPRNTSEGNYNLQLSFTTKEQYKLPTLTLQVTVKKYTLPAPSDWAFHLDLWQYPLRVARYYKVKPWSPEHFNILKPSMQKLAAGGQKAITASFFWDSFNNEDWGEDSRMIKVHKAADGSFQYDYTNFDKWVTFMMGLGISDQINCFGMNPFGNKMNLYYTDAVQQSRAIKSSAALLSKGYNDFWGKLLVSFAAHLRQKGWMEKTVLFFDERPAKETMDIVNFIKGVEPDFKIGYAGAYNPQLNNFLSDFSIASYLKIDPDALAARKRAGRTTTFYTTCMEKKPNLFSFSDPAESVFMGWFAFANNYDGFLRYGYDMWETNSLDDTRSSIVPAGDKFIIYPQNYSSVRFEKLVEGIQDYEKLRILKKALQNNQPALKKLNDVLEGFTLARAKGISDYSEYIDNAKKVINSL